MLPLLAALLILPQTYPADVDFNRQLDTVDPTFQAGMQAAAEKEIRKFNLVGATVVVAIDGKLMGAVGAGKRKFGAPDPILVTDPMQIGSNTKGMTALIFARLVEEGKLRFREKAQDLFSFALSEDFASLPLIEFLYQRSGINDTSAPKIFADKYLPADGQDYLHGPPSQYFRARQTYTQDCLTGKAGYKPQSEFQYCNSNYIVAGAIEEQVTGKYWEELMEREVFKPLHMKAAGFSAMGDGKDVSVPWQHSKENGSWKPVFWDNPRYMGPAGLVHCSALDLANYAYAQASGALGNSRYLSSQSWRTLQNPPAGSYYACGIATAPPDANGVRDMSHNGSNNLSYSEWLIRDHARIVIVSMVNTPSGEGNQAIIDDVLALARQKMADVDATRSPNR